MGVREQPPHHGSKSKRGKEVKTMERICDNCEHCEEDAKEYVSAWARQAIREILRSEDEATEEVNHGDGEEE